MNEWMNEHWISVSPNPHTKALQDTDKASPASQPSADTTHTRSNLTEKQTSADQNRHYINRPGPNSEVQEMHVALQFPLLSSCPSLLQCCYHQAGADCGQTAKDRAQGKEHEEMGGLPQATRVPSSEKAELAHAALAHGQRPPNTEASGSAAVAREKHWTWDRKTQNQVQRAPLISHVALGELLNHFVKRG